VTTGLSILSPSWPGNVPAIHVLLTSVDTKTWMPATSPGMTTLGHVLYLLKSGITPLATSLFQMNRTTSAPMVAVMKPAPWSGP
jgi:hypothetical protein